jgi:hypothetical protein
MIGPRSLPERRLADVGGFRVCGEGVSEKRATLRMSGPLPKCELHVAVNDVGLLPGTSLHPNTKQRAGLFVTPIPKHLFRLKDWFSGQRAASRCGNSGIRPGLLSDEKKKRVNTGSPAKHHAGAGASRGKCVSVTVCLAD